MEHQNFVVSPKQFDNSTLFYNSSANSTNGLSINSSVTSSNSVSHQTSWLQNQHHQLQQQIQSQQQLLQNLRTQLDAAIQTQLSLQQKQEQQWQQWTQQQLIELEKQWQSFVTEESRVAQRAKFENQLHQHRQQQESIFSSQLQQLQVRLRRLSEQERLTFQHEANLKQRLSLLYTRLENLNQQLTVIDHQLQALSQSLNALNWRFEHGQALTEEEQQQRENLFSSRVTLLTQQQQLRKQQQQLLMQQQQIQLALKQQQENLLKETTETVNLQKQLNLLLSKTPLFKSLVEDVSVSQPPTSNTHNTIKPTTFPNFNTIISERPTVNLSQSLAPNEITGTTKPTVLSGSSVNPGTLSVSTDHTNRSSGQAQFLNILKPNFQLPNTTKDIQLLLSEYHRSNRVDHERALLALLKQRNISISSFTTVGNNIIGNTDYRVNAFPYSIQTGVPQFSQYQKNQQQYSVNYNRQSHGSSSVSSSSSSSALGAGSPRQMYRQDIGIHRPIFFAPYENEPPVQHPSVITHRIDHTNQVGRTFLNHQTHNRAISNGLFQKSFANSVQNGLNQPNAYNKNQFYVNQPNWNVAPSAENDFGQNGEINRRYLTSQQSAQRQQSFNIGNNQKTVSKVIANQRPIQPFGFASLPYTKLAQQPSSYQNTIKNEPITLSTTPVSTTTIAASVAYYDGPFTCAAQPFGNGYYADIQSGCRQYHFCSGRRQFTLNCLPPTLFNQRTLSCTASKFNCDQSLQLFAQQHSEQARQQLQRNVESKAEDQEIIEQERVSDENDLEQHQI